MSRRTVLIKILRNTTWSTPYADVEAMADAVLADGWAPEIPAVIDSVDELDGLPLDSVVRNAATGEIHRRVTQSSYCWDSGDQHGRRLSETLFDRGTLQLIFVPHTPSKA